MWRVFETVPLRAVSHRWSRLVDYDILEARYVRDFIVWLRFRDGLSGEVDLRDSLRGPIFQPLHDIEFFKRFTVHPEWETLVWPNGADMAPDSLHMFVRGELEAKHHAISHSGH